MNSVSVIIPTRNRHKKLFKCLESIFCKNVYIEQFEVIVIDNGSNDSTRNIVEKFATKYENISYYYNEIAGLHIGRHIGLQYSKYQWLAYLDDDVILQENWFSVLFSINLVNDRTKLIASRVLPLYESNPPFWISNQWEKYKNIFELSIIDLGDNEQVVSPYSVYGCCFIVDKKFLLDIDGFHPDAMPWDLIAFRGDGESYVSWMAEINKFVAIYNPQLITYHWVSNNRMTFKYFLKRHFMQGISDCFTAIRLYWFAHNMLIQPTPSKSIYLEFKKIIFKFITLNTTINFREFIFLCAHTTGYYYLIYKFKHDFKIKNWVLKTNYLEND